ncbi:EamA domain-containing membrane protein RarD [Allofrancisella inopinata]|uniref:DMT family transporter n=1 Tax=Allofrancisella inopinata TaxID=1085647 RepID=A0AAE7CRQ3_9GAMM|nr:DMT family transporter [Allofrancisella inopinata]QIV95928.1 DMT family transporter [Allofrancisella inopinata]TDT74347.1 EamA domain-containing membrane protein RarD [Allofrancisella inopinata]
MEQDSRALVIFGLCCILVAQFVTGINITGSKYLVEHVPLIFLLEMRFIIGAISLLIILMISGKTPQVLALKSMPRKAWWVLVAQGLCGGALFNLLMLSGIHYTSATMAGIITSTLPAMVILAMWLLLKISITLKQWICVVAAIIGLIMVNLQYSHASTSVNSISWLGNLLILIAMLPETGYYVLIKVIRIPINPLIGSIIINVINAIFVLPMLLWVDFGFIKMLSMFDWVMLLILGVASGLFYLCWSKGSEYLQAPTTGMLTALMPIFTLILAVLFLNEKITIIQMIGMLVIISSIIIANYRIRRLKI